jgi:acetyl-CoA carboxylase biotin carboxyl carrier protein
VLWSKKNFNTSDNQSITQKTSVSLASGAARSRRGAASFFEWGRNFFFKKVKTQHCLSSVGGASVNGFRNGLAPCAFWRIDRPCLRAQDFQTNPKFFFPLPPICQTFRSTFLHKCMDFNQIQELIRLVSKQKISEFVWKDGDVKLVIRQGQVVEHSAPVVVAAPPQMMAMPQPVAAAPAAMPVAAPTPSAAPAAAAAAPADATPAGGVTIKSPMVGTFYRSAGPDKAAFVKIGDIVEVGNTVCIIEAMKLFNEIESDVKGKIVKILVDDATPVEYDQPLFLVEPA